MTQTLKNKVALVTGGSRGMGSDIAKKLADLGATVAITYASSADKANQVVADIQKSGGKAIAIKADSGNVDDIKSSIAKVAAEFGGIDILVNNAGIMMNGMVQDYNIDDFDRMIAVNVKGVFVSIQESLKHMKSGGRIVNIGSVMSDYAIFPGAAVYTMTKAAVAGLTKGLARDLGPKCITINNVQPGPIDTDMNPADGPGAAGMVAMMPVGAYGKGTDIANAVAFFVSPDSSFITGASLHVDGGALA